MNKSNLQSTNSNTNQSYLFAGYCWNLATVSLWPHCLFSDEVQKNATRLLYSLIITGTDMYKTYLEICQRILLTRKRMLDDAGFRISSFPCRFFTSAEKGFQLSGLWFTELLAERKRSATHKIELRALPEAILEFAEDPVKDNFDYWKTWFLENNAKDEWIMYSMCAANILIEKNNIR